MDSRFSANHVSNGMEADYATDTVLRLDSKGVKRKWSLRDESMDVEGEGEGELPLCLWAGCSSSSSDSKASSVTGCTAMSCYKETDEDSSMDLELDFTLHLGGEKGKKASSFNKLSLDLSLSSTPTSSVTCLSHQQQNRNTSTKICKRSKFVECGKSAQGSMDFCKAYGGGKRCSWGLPGSEYGESDSVCNLFARGENGLCTSHGALVQDKRVHGGATLGTLVQDTTEDMNIDFSGYGLKPFGVQQVFPAERGSSLVSEGRVHGGSLIALLAGATADSANPVHQKWI